LAGGSARAGIAIAQQVVINDITNNTLFILKSPQIVILYRSGLAIFSAKRYKRFAFSFPVDYFLFSIGIWFPTLLSKAVPVKAPGTAIFLPDFQFIKVKKTAVICLHLFNR
jgi:hypothetical protein